MMKLDPSKNRIQNPNGFGILEIIVGLASFMIVFIVNSEIITMQMTNVRKLNHRLAATLIHQNVGALLGDEEVIDRLFQSHTMGTLTINSGSQNMGVRCIVDNRTGPKTMNCTHQFPPTLTFPTACAGIPKRDDQILCWVQNDLDNYRVDVLPHPDPAKTALTDILIDVRNPTTAGLSPDFKVCDQFSDLKTGGNGIACPYQVQLYAWVECDGGAPLCGAATGVSGRVKMAAIIKPHGAVGNLNIARYSILNIDAGPLL